MSSTSALQKEQQSPATAHLFTTRFSEYFKPPVETYPSEGGKRTIHLKVLLSFIDNTPGYPGALAGGEVYSKINVVNSAVHTTTILQPRVEE